MTSPAAGVARSRAALRPGYTAGFIRWLQVGDDWQSEIVMGRFLGSENGAWIIETAGQRRELPESTWSIYRA